MIDGFRGSVVVPDDPAYDDARRIWNRAAGGRPALIARCADADDVSRAVRLARSRGLPMTVRAGGHSFAGWSMIEDSVVLDLRDLTAVTVEEDRRIAHLGAGLRWGAVDHALRESDLATAGGSVSTVGVSGFTLGTGLGFLSRSLGLAGDNVLGATVVTADGEIAQVGLNADPELFWALRGGGGCGVVTQWQMQLHQVRMPVAGPLIYPIEQAAQVLRQVLQITHTAPADFSWAAILTTAPPDPALPASIRGKPALLLPVFSTSADADAVVAQLRRSTRPVLDLAGRTPLAAFHRSSDAAAPDGNCWDVRSEWLHELDETALQDAADLLGRASSPLSEVLLRPLGGAVAAPNAPDTPFSFRSAAFLVEVIAHWAEGDGAAERAWMVQTWSALRRLSAGGADVNHLGLGEGPDRACSAYHPDVLARLAAVRRAYDPDGVWLSPLVHPAAGYLARERRMGGF